MLTAGQQCLTDRSCGAVRGTMPWLVKSALVWVPLLAWAQPHVKEDGDYILWASTVSAQALPEAMRNKYGIPPGPGKGMLNVTVQRKLGGEVRNVPARIDVPAHDLMGIPTSVDLQQVSAQAMVSYLGVYDFLPREVLDFRILAWPQGSDSSIELAFTDRLGRE